MDYEFSFYSERDYNEIMELVLSSYQWEIPVWGLSRMEFTRWLHPHYLGIHRAWERTAGIYRIGGKIAACAFNEGNDEGDIFFLFDSRRRAEEEELLREMLYFAKTTMSSVQKGGITRYAKLRIPKWNRTLRTVAEESGFKDEGGTERVNILPFSGRKFSVELPEGYQFADGEITPDFYLSNVHMGAFNYGISTAKNSEAAFHSLRRAGYYNPKLDVCIIDPMKRPVAMAVIWYDERMPYCELEPLGVVWWERRKHLATSLLHEVANRVMELFPECRGMSGGEQLFYEKIGYINQCEVPVLKWQLEIYPSWDERSLRRNYSEEL